MSGEAAFVGLLRGFATAPEARGLVDDCAVLGDLVLTHDMMVAGTHYSSGADPADVAWKLVGTNLSDLAAKGAQPIGVLMGYMLGDTAWDTAFASGLRDALARYETALWGGDTVSAPSWSQTRAIGLTAVGRALHLPVPTRGGARPGDHLWVTGWIGDAMAGHASLEGGEPAAEEQRARFLRPTPRLAEGAALAPFVTAMMDVSDGLLLDARRMAQAAGVAIDITAAAVPMRIAGDRRDAGMRWGDDYELLFTLPADIEPPCAATRIGEVCAAGQAMLTIDGQPVSAEDRLGYQHGATCAPAPLAS